MPKGKRSFVEINMVKADTFHIFAIEISHTSSSDESPKTNYYIIIRGMSE